VAIVGELVGLAALVTILVIDQDMNWLGSVKKLGAYNTIEFIRGIDRWRSIASLFQVGMQL
jgi:hypothetical protein